MRFNDKARHYDHYSQVQEALAQWGRAWLPLNSPADARVLELGAGTGAFTHYLCKNFYTLEASDIAVAMLAQGKSRFPHIRWTRRDAWNLDGGPWDWLCSASLLQWALQPAATLRTWRQCLAQQGRVLANFYTQGTLQELYSISPSPASLPWRDTAWWVDAFTSVGLRPIRYETISKRMFYDSPIALLRSLHHTGAFAPQQTTYSQMRQLLARYAAQFRSQEKVYATWMFTRIEAERA